MVKVRLEALNILCTLFRGEMIFLDSLYSVRIKVRGYSAADRSLLVHLIRGVVKYKSSLEKAAYTYLSKWNHLPKKVQIILLLGLFQLAFDTRTPAYAIVHETVELARLSSSAYWVKLLNAVLRRASEERDRWQIEATNWEIDLPAWLEDEWLRLIGSDDLKRLKKSLTQPPRLFLRVNTLKTTPQELSDLFTRQYFFLVEFSPILSELLVTDADYSQLTQIPEFQKGLFSIQDLGSQMMVHLFSPAPGEKIVDIGCGSGGKTAMMAQMMKNKGRIYAVDIHLQKIQTMTSLINRQGINIVQPVVADATQSLPSELFGADRVFVDAPCSGWGTLRRNPEILLNRRESDLKTFADQQLQLLLKSSALLKKGGMILYCVCTITPEETFGVVNAFESFSKNEWQKILPGESMFSHAVNHLIVTEGRHYLIWPYYFYSDGFFGVAWRKV